MKADQRKELETNSLVLGVQRLRQRLTGRNLYYLVGTVALIVGAFLLYRYLTRTSSKARDAVLLQLASADTPEKLKAGMEEHRGTVYGGIFKIRLADHHLLNEGLPKLGTDSPDQKKQAAASLETARTYYLELTGEVKEKEEPGLLQQAWFGAAQAEEALVGMPTAPGGNDSRGSADKAIEYYRKAAAILPDSELSKRYKEWADKLEANKQQFVDTQKRLHAERPAPSFGPSSPGSFGPSPGKDGPFDHGFPSAPRIEPPPEPKPDTPPPPRADAPGAPKADAPKLDLPPVPKGDAPKIEVPPIPGTPDPKKATPEPKPADPPKTDPKAK
jgi:hypothetical protein